MKICGRQTSGLKDECGKRREPVVGKTDPLLFPWECFPLHITYLLLYIFARREEALHL